MKTKLSYLLTVFFCLILASCSTDEPAFTLSQNTFDNIPPEGKNLSLQIQTSGEWTATSLNKDWCSVTPATGTGNGTISIEVSGNISKDRTGTIVIYCNGTQTNININQKALPEGEELTYRIPVIFHVLYKDKNDQHQYISDDRIKQVLNKVNQYYKGKTVATGGDAGQDINLEFYLPENDEAGNQLETPGIEYIAWDEMPIDCEAFMESKNSKILNMLWDMNKYINIMLYNFAEVEGGTILGISHLPLSTQGKNYLEGLQAVDYTHMENSHLGYPHCVSINTLYFDQDTQSNSYNSADANVTLAHELGHYLGLHHAFNESSEDINADSDYCLDTPPYNRSLYEQSVMIPAYQAWQASNFDMTALQPGFLRTNSLNPEQTFTSYNLMDYEISHSDRFTLNQRERMRHVLEYSPLIPGPKRTASTRSVAPQGVLDIPIIYKVCYMH
ncbi:MAG TPA: zinc-dependent metalloproteinase lipoprotein [Bacteroides togonis]|nr:zinc-dependent metalloproteinase lipoprotein [Bacteroides togonis]